MSFGLLAVFGAGLLTFVTPCVLPMVPIYLSALVGGDLSSLGNGKKGQLLMRTAMFSMGFILVFTAMGLGASSIGAVLSTHKAVIQAIGAIIVLFFALKFLGLIRIPWLDRTAKLDDQRLSTRFAWLNAFVMGIVFAAGWSPCVGPVLGSVLTYTAANTSSMAAGAGYLTVFGLGFALPLLITAVFAEAATKFLRKISPLLPKIERATGVLLLALAGYLAFEAYSVSNAFIAPSSHEQIAEQDDAASDFLDDLPVMVELYSKDCPICQKMEPVVKGITDQCDQKGVRVKAIDISKPENAHYLDTYRVVGVPTFLFIGEDGFEDARLVGEQTEQTLKQALSALRGEKCPGLAILDSELEFPDQEKHRAAACGS